MTPDGEAIAVAHLLADSDVGALADDRIATKTLDEIDEPWVKITQIDDSPSRRSTALHLVTATLQFECYGSSDADVAELEAGDLARAVRAALHGMPAAEHEGAVVSSVTFGPMPHLPDPDFTPSRQRYVLDAYIVMHATEVIS